jgi:hypothetical protein
MTANKSYIFANSAIFKAYAPLITLAPFKGEREG